MNKFVVFGDGSVGIRGAANRLGRQAKESGLFSSGVKIWDAKTLELCFSSEYPEALQFILSHRKGFGYWVWQPMILLYELLESSEDDILLMLDAGCQLNICPSSIGRFNEYVDLVHETGALFMQIRRGSFGLGRLEEVYWNKRETVAEIPTSGEALNSNQIQSGIICMRRNQANIEFVQEWLRLCLLDNFRLTLDAQDVASEIDGFQSHRYSQSILSLLVKNSHYSVIQDETYWAPNWSNGTAFPIWAMRNRSGGDAYRRNLVDKVKIALAKMERGILEFFNHRQ